MVHPRSTYDGRSKDGLYLVCTCTQRMYMWFGWVCHVHVCASECDQSPASVLKIQLARPGCIKRRFRGNYSYFGTTCAIFHLSFSRFRLIKIMFLTLGRSGFFLACRLDRWSKSSSSPLLRCTVMAKPSMRIMSSTNTTASQ